MIGGGRFHFIGSCGRAMSAIAIALARTGAAVSGSDEHTYGTARDELRRAGVTVAPRFSPDNLPAGAVVVIGKRITVDNPEWRAAIARGLRCVSFPALLRERFLGTSRNAVVAGGVGKTTTTAMLAWILEYAGLSPDYLIGGSAPNFGAPARFAGAGITVLEGDEYGSSESDLTPKFMHYQPAVALVTNVVEDHPDLYADVSSLRRAFESFVELLPAHGALVVSSDDPGAAALIRAAACRHLSVGFDGASVPIEALSLAKDYSSFRLSDTAFRAPIFGAMNVRNAAMAAAAASQLGVPYLTSAAALSHFKGVLGRQQSIETGASTLVTDKATHPLSFRELSTALHQRHPGRRLVAVVEPRATGGRHWIYQRDLPAALALYDRVVLTRPYEHKPPAHTRWEDQPFSIDQLAADLSRLGTIPVLAESLEVLPSVVADLVEDGDVGLLSLREQHAHHGQAIAAALERAASAERRSGL